MSPIRWLRLRLRAVVARRAIERDMQDEMREHLDRATERLMARGIPEREARLAARREFGNVTAIQAEARDARGGRWVDALAGDSRFALRYFARHKATTAILVTVLALGTGANTFIVSLVQATFLRPAPAVPADEALVRLWAQERGTQRGSWAPRAFTRDELQALAARREAFRDVAGWSEDEVVLRADSAPPRGVGAQFVTPNLFPLLGVPLVAGQGFRRDAAEATEPTAVLAHATATQLYGTPEAAVGRRLLVNEQPVFVVGVAPERFQGPIRSMNDAELWIPVAARASVVPSSPRWLADSAVLSLAARLAPGASREQATALARQVVAGALPDSAARVGMARTADAIGMADVPPGPDARDALLAITMVGILGVLILLVAWMNVSSLMVAAAVGRRHEVAVRLSLGASRPRIMRQLVTESVLLACVGAIAGLAGAWGVLGWMQRTEIDGVDLSPDGATFAFVFLMALATGVLFGLSPALHATRDAVAGALRDSGTGSSHRSRLQRGFVVAQIALSQPLLVLLGTVVMNVLGDYRPLAPATSRRVVAVSVRPLATGAPGQRPQDVDALVRRLAERPEVEGAVPEATAFAIRGIVVPDALRPDSQQTIVHLEGAAPGWFRVQDVPIVLGRDVALADSAAPEHPVVIGSDLARRLWGEKNPLGRTLPSPSIPGWKQDSITLTVVGVYGAAQRLAPMSWQGYQSTSNSPVTRIYTAHGQQWRRDRLLLRTRGPAAPFVPELRRALREMAPSLPVTRVLTLEQVDAEAFRATLRMTALAGGGGALALLLASLGLYGVVALAVRQRTREIGIRIAVGASPVGVARMFLASGVRTGAVALAIGLPLSLAALKLGLAQGVLIAPHVNPILIGAVVATTLLAVAAAATWVPARRAARVDPARTLRTE